MKKILFTSIAIPLLQASTAYADFTLADLQGQYDYSMSATAKPNQNKSYLTEVGVFSADGQGHLTGEGKTTRSNVLGDLIESVVTYDCLYTVKRNGSGKLDCVLEREGNFSNAAFSFVFDKEINSLGTDPDAVENVPQEMWFHSISKLSYKITDANGELIDESYNAIGTAHRQSDMPPPPPQPQGSRYTNVDADGKYLIDILFVITSDAKAQMDAAQVDPDEWAMEHINRTNAELERSQITTSKLRYIGKHYVDETDYKRTGRYPDSSNGTHVLFWLSKYRAAYGADKIAVIHENVWNNGGGDAASFPYNRTLPFSHEIGHTMNISHGGCDGGDYTTKRYNSGAQFRWLNFDANGEEVLPYPPGAGTIMCGNDSGFYSNANLTLSWEQIEQYVADGHLPNDLSFYEPLRETGMKMGHTDYADAARTWMEGDEAASNRMPTSLPHDYTEDEWYQDDNCVAFYSEKNYLGSPTDVLCTGEISANDPNTLQAQSIKVGRNAAVRYFAEDNYMGELSTLIYSSYNLQDYGDARNIDLTNAHSVVVFPRDDRDYFLRSSYSEVQTIGENNDWTFPSGITATKNGDTIYVLLGHAIDAYDTTTGALIKRIDIGNMGAYQWGLGITKDGKLFMPSEKSDTKCQIINPQDGTLTEFPNCSGNDADIDSEGNLYVVNRLGYISKYAVLEDGSFSSERERPIDDTGNPSGTGWLSLAIDQTRNLVNILSLDRCRVLVYDLSTGEYLRSIGAGSEDGCTREKAQRGELTSPYGIAVDNNGWVYVTESRDPWYLTIPLYFNVGVQVYDENGNFVDQFGVTMQDPSHVVVPNNGKIYVMDSANVKAEPGPSRVIAFQPQSQLL